MSVSQINFRTARNDDIYHDEFYTRLNFSNGLRRLSYLFVYLFIYLYILIHIQTEAEV